MGTRGPQIRLIDANIVIGLTAARSHTHRRPGDLGRRIAAKQILPQYPNLQCSPDGHLALAALGSLE